MDDIKWFAALLLIFAVLWLGGRTASVERKSEAATSTARTVTERTVPPTAQQTQKQQKTPLPTANQNAPLNLPIGSVISEATFADGSPSETSPLQGKLSVGSITRGATPDKEYVVIQAGGRNREDIVITGLTVRSSVSFNAHTIGKGWALYYPQTTGEGEPIRLRPGGRAVILSGRSPLGSIPLGGGFQLNRCTGFFEQGLNFYPSLPIDCPSPKDEPLPEPPNALSDACYDYLAKIKRCMVPTSIPEYLRNDGSCQAHIFNRINYNQCVADNKDLPNFFRGEWRIYLGRSSKLWRDRHDTVELVDQNGKLIDTRGY